MKHANTERLITVPFWKWRDTNGSNMLLLVNKKKIKYNRNFGPH
jgi:hypothetical protein